MGSGTKITAIIPAHNEEAGITEAVLGLRNQTRPPDSIIVVCDNCVDRTAILAREAGAHVMHTLNNKSKKGGALNFALRKVLPLCGDKDLILIQDADSALDSDFVELAETRHNKRRHHAEPPLGAIGGIFRGSEGGGFVGHLQRNEYARYARDVKRLGGKCLVVTGTAAMFRAKVLREISQGRLNGTLPSGDKQGGVYDTTVLTEDNEITFALLHLGYRVLSPPECTLVTEVMKTWKELCLQRLRWKRGAIENCIQYGLTKVTWRYWGRQVLTAFGVLVTAVYLASIAASIFFYGGINLQPIWLAVTGIFVVERIVTVRYRGWKYMVVAATMYEMILDFVLQAVHAVAYFQAAFRLERKW